MGSFIGKYDTTDWSGLSGMFDRHPDAKYCRAVGESDKSTYFKVLPGIYSMRWRGMWSENEDDGCLWETMFGLGEGGVQGYRPA